MAIGPAVQPYDDRLGKTPWQVPSDSYVKNQPVMWNLATLICPLVESTHNRGN